MAQIIKYIVDGFYDIMDNYGDQRVKDWPLMSSPFPTITMSLCYAIFVTKIGPKLMENRKPFELKYVLIVYNALQVIFSAWLFKEAAMGGWLTNYNWRCQPVDYSNDPQAVRMANGCWWYFISKFTEFFDTFFFVLRKKNDHISTLHVIHHGIMPVSVWWGVKFFPGGQSTFFGFLNTFIHIIMYTYYMLAAFGPKIQKYLWWKKYLTLLQMVQFVAIILHALQALFIECNYPKSLNWYIAAHGVLFYFLFSNFYKQSYQKKDRKNKEGVQENNKSKKAPGICFIKQTALYETSDKEHSMKNGYTTENSSNLRNRAFVDNESSKSS